MRWVVSSEEIGGIERLQRGREVIAGSSKSKEKIKNVKQGS